jgi:amino acid adenylation domain-containing protein
MITPSLVATLKQTEPAPLELPITAYLEAQAARTPDLPAVRFDGSTLTYAQFHRRANRVARELVARGIGRDSLVGVYMDRGIEMVVALVAIVKAGAAYVPLDPEYPHERLAAMFGDSGVDVVLTQRRFEPNDLFAGLGILYLDDPFWLETDERDDLCVPAACAPDSAAYMIYTSGSTGKPKGVVNIHRGLVNRLLWMQDTFQLGAGDRVLQKTPYSFDVSVWEFFWPLITGACLVVARPGGHRENDYLVRTIVNEAITTIHFVPSMLSLFLTANDLDGITTLRQVMSSGEALPLDLTRRFFAKLPAAKLHNLYGPTEAAIDVTHWECTPASTRNVVPIGRAIANIKLHVLDEAMAQVPDGETGELHIGGVGLARGYWKRPELTAERFVKDPFSPDPGARLYKTGDLARVLPDGSIEYLGRLDFQVKLRGFRIELGEIEAVLLKHPSVLEAVVIATDDALDDRQLVAYVVCEKSARPSTEALRATLLVELPEYMVPARFVFLESMPLTPSGKVDRKALPKDLVERPELSQMYVAPSTPLQKQLCDIWATLLGVGTIGIRDNFFEVGGNSIRAVRLTADIKRLLQRDVPVVKLFEYPSVEKLAQYLSSSGTADQLLDDANERATRLRIGRFSNSTSDGIAVIGMVGRFPGAANLEQLWQNLCNRVESITRFSLDELGPGIDDETRNDPDYVPTRGIVDDADKFDARFFGIGPLEAKVMDPQQRVFLELAWAALENAGHDAQRFPGMIGVYAGVGDNHYFTNNVLAHPDLVKTVGRMIVGYGNEKDYIATRVSYSLDLTGPSVSANTGCSTSLLAVDHAFKALIDFECDMALAGGVDIFVPQKSGQLYKEGGTFTKDGHCRPFDAEATGTMFCDGAGIVVLRRLEDALAAGDRIYAVIRGIAKNNDGANKVSFLAPSVEGQAKVIALAQAQANVPAETISYVEAHGTGTPLGDPIEIEALTRAFRATTDKKGFCGIGSVKGNIGHPTIASGVAGLIKASLALYHETIPATLHFQRPNPRINFEDSPFKVVTETTPWPRGDRPRRAAVSSFGFGGTNVHAILEEAPLPSPPAAPARPAQLLLYSGKTEAAAHRLRAELESFFASHPGVDLADAAFTTHVGRKALAFRQCVVAGTAEEACKNLAALAKAPLAQLTVLDPEVVFLFPGQGAQYAGMGRGLYASERVFRQAIDECCAGFTAAGVDLASLLFPKPGDEGAANEQLKDTRFTQPALFTVEYALARLWMSLGVGPKALVGHSVAEFVCACIAGALPLPDAIRLVALRGRLMGSMPPGAMLSVRAGADSIAARLPADLQLAASNAPNLCVVAGPKDAVAAFAATLEKEQIVAKLLQTSHAFHSSMMEPIVGEFMDAVAKVRWGTPQIPVMSTCLGDWMTAETMASPGYWAKQLRMPVLFSNAIRKLVEPAGRVFLEVGPKDVLSTLTRQHVGPKQRPFIVPTLGAVSGASGDDELPAYLRALGNLWKLGVSVSFDAFHAGEHRRRIPLPTYQFERTSYWLEPAAREVVSERECARPGACLLDGAPESCEQAGSIDNCACAAESKADEVLSQLASIVQETAGISVDASFRDTPFVALGMDSLLLMQLSQIVKTRLSFAVSFRQLVQEYATPGLLEAAIRTARAASATASCWCVEERAPVQATSDATQRRELPSTLEQRELWRMAQLSVEASCADNESFYVHLQGRVDETAMRAAVEKLATMHEALRGHFSEDGTQFIIEPQSPVPFEQRDLSHLPSAERAFVLRRLCEDESRTCISLAKGPLYRATLLRLGADEWVLLLTAHRSICDGWSLDVLLDHLARIYTASVSTAVPPDLTRHGLSDFVVWRSGDAQRARTADSIRYWTRALEPMPPDLDFAHATEQQSRRTFGALHVRRVLGAELVSQVRGLARKEVVSSFAVMVSAVATLIRQRARRTDFVLGIPIAGHPNAGLEDAVGYLASIVPLRVKGHDRDSFSELCQRINGSLLEAVDNAMVGFEQVAAAMNVASDAQWPALHRVAVSHMHKYSPSQLQFGDCAVDYQLNARAFERHDLSINVIEAEDHIELLVHGNSDIFGQEWLATLAADIETVLRGSCSSPSVALVELAQQMQGGPITVAANASPTRWNAKIELPIAATLQRGQPGKTPLLSLFGIQLYIDVATAITDGTPVIGVHVPILCVPGRTPRPSLETVAGYYLNAVRTIQPSGPYQLAGFCFGGVVAYEVARLLEAEGEKVQLVVVIDSVLPHGRHVDPIGRIAEYVGNPSAVMQRTVRRMKARVLPLVSAAKAGATSGSETTVRLVDLPVDTPEASKSVELFAASRLRIDARLLGIRASRPNLPAWHVIHPDMGWTAFAHASEFCAIPSNHLGIMRPPYARQAGEAIMRAIANAHADCCHAAEPACAVTTGARVSQLES